MATLVGNVHVDGVWWGPAHGNADQVPADVAARITNPKAWADGPPTVDPDASGGDDTGPEPPTPQPGAPDVPAEATGGDVREADEAPTDVDRGQAPVDLASMDKDQLIAHIEAHGQAVDKRLGVDNLRPIAEALHGA